MIEKPTIVVIAYNRPISLKRILHSLKEANYDCEDIRLVISIDKADDDKGVKNIAKEFKWPHGEKKVIIQEQRLGLRKHVLKCGDLALRYSSIIMLEDDLVVSKEFYKYACESVKYYKDEVQIAQISLFNYEVNEFASNKQFRTIQDGSDVYFIQTPSSWGQVWTDSQWKKFRTWYDNEEYLGVDYTEKVPSTILNWPETSWKKYFAMYMAHKDLFAVYPRVSLTTNMADVGTHYKEQSNNQQVNLLLECDRNFIFKDLSKSNCKYDSFMESLLIKDYLKIDDLSVNYFGYQEKNKTNKYLLTPEILSYKVEKSWSLRLKPYELNIIYSDEGQGLFLYNTEIQDNKNNNLFIEINKLKYQNGSLSKKDLLKIMKYKLFRLMHKK
ncbi:MAG: glycosyltransferase [Intestinibacter bartlettii]|uniref:glycosyltransferase n=1 Tax=Intestinibacter bartlettii TaxID=261299 RepID=UPI0026EE0F5B|nr:glycosyltransferase [Intestinibacter bartlettii]MDO5011711.1 glycosyltransferase [Intestinibacter bartlettii]